MMKMTRPVFENMITHFRDANQLIFDDDGPYQLWAIYKDVRGQEISALLDVLSPLSGVIIEPEITSNGGDPTIWYDPDTDGMMIKLQAINDIMAWADVPVFPATIYGYYIQNPNTGELKAYELFAKPITFFKRRQAVMLPTGVMRFPVSMVG